MIEDTNTQGEPTPQRLAFGASVISNDQYTLTPSEGTDTERLNPLREQLEAGQYDDQISAARHTGQPVPVIVSNEVIGTIRCADAYEEEVSVTDIEVEDIY